MESKLKIVLELTIKQADELNEILSMRRDCGPIDEGWQSGELIELSFIISEAIEKAKKSNNL